MTTDGFVVTPWRFPGGDIGSLAVHGSINDLAMAGAKPLALSAAFILEEGFPVADLASVVESMRRAADQAGVAVVTGDTKVVERGKGDGVYVVTTGLGAVLGKPPSPKRVRPGDAVIVSGDLGRHGAAVMSAREGLDLETPVLSDSASVVQPALALKESGIDVHCLRDATRGGIASILNEIALSAELGIVTDEASIPIADDVHGICELLGLDPLYLACEGRFVAFVPASDAEHALAVLRRFAVSREAASIGFVDTVSGSVRSRSRIGVERIVDLMSGEQLPRIC